jgi:hypothetical protein
MPQVGLGCADEHHYNLEMASVECPDPKPTVVKTLFAHSGNVCAFFDLEKREGCEQPLTDPKWKKVIARICHIAGRREGSARWDPSLTCEEINAYENLILLCPLHHAKIDDAEPDRFPVEVLLDMKARHEMSSERHTVWSTEIDLEIFAELCLTQMHAIWQAQLEDSSSKSLPDVSFRHLPGGELRALNRGPGPASLRAAKVMIGPEASVAFAEFPSEPLGEDASIVVGRFDPTALDDGEIVIRLTWSASPSGRERSKNLHIEKPSR